MKAKVAKDEAMKASVIQQILNDITTQLLNRYLHFQQDTGLTNDKKEDAKNKLANKHITTINDYVDMCCQYQAFDTTDRIVDATKGGLSIYEQICLNIDSFNYLFGLTENLHNQEQRLGSESSLSPQENSPLALRQKEQNTKNNRLLLTSMAVVGTTFAYHASQTETAEGIRKYLYETMTLGTDPETMEKQIEEATNAEAKARKALNDANTALQEAKNNLDSGTEFSYSEEQHRKIVSDVRTCAAQSQSFEDTLMRGKLSDPITLTTGEHGDMSYPRSAEGITGILGIGQEQSKQSEYAAVQKFGEQFITTGPKGVLYQEYKYLTPEAKALKEAVEKAMKRAQETGSGTSAWAEEAKEIIGNWKGYDYSSGDLQKGELTNMFSKLTFFEQHFFDNGGARCLRIPLLAVFPPLLFLFSSLHPQPASFSG